MSKALRYAIDVFKGNVHESRDDGTYGDDSGFGWSPPDLNIPSHETARPHIYHYNQRVWNRDRNEWGTVTGFLGADKDRCYRVEHGPEVYTVPEENLTTDPEGAK